MHVKPNVIKNDIHSYLESLKMWGMAEASWLASRRCRANRVATILLLLAEGDDV